MAHLQATNGQPTNFWDNLGQKLKTTSEVAGAIKGIWDVGKTVYGGNSTIGNGSFIKQFADYYI